MKIKFLTVAVIGLLGMMGQGFAVTTGSGTKCFAVTDCQTAQTTIRPGNCDSYDSGLGPVTVNGSCSTIYSCTSCSSTYHTETVELGDILNAYCQYVTCVENTCTNCDSTSWAAYGSAGQYESRTTATCNKATNPGTCTKSTEYRCAKGYYGSPTSGTSGCTACPNGGTTKSAGTTSVSNCYIPSGTSFNDGTGSGSYTSDCYY